MEKFDADGREAGDTEEEAVVHFAQATEELMMSGLRMAARLQPAEFATAMEAIRRGALRPQLVVEFEDPVRIALLGIAPDGREGARIFSFDVRIVKPFFN